MSKLGFDRDLREVRKVAKSFLRQGMNLAQKEFKNNFDTQSNTETGEAWEDVQRGTPPPILDVTGELRANTLSKGNVQIYDTKAVLTVDPIDSRGKGYAEYHQDGIGVEERAFLTQSENLTDKQEELLMSITDNAFKTFIS